MLEVQLNDHYDWIVMGDHPGALLSAALAAKMGYQVLVVPLYPSYLTRMTDAGQCLDPESNFLLGMARDKNSNGLLGHCLSQLGIPPLGFKAIKMDNDYLPQIVTPQRRLRFFSDLKLLEAELNREFGEAFIREHGMTQAISHSDAMSMKFWQTFPERLSQPGRLQLSRGSSRTMDHAQNYLSYQSSWIRGKNSYWLNAISRVSKMLEKTQSHELAEYCCGLWYATTGMDSPDPKLVDFLQAISLARSGASFQGGMSGYRRFLISLARKLGATVPQQVDCRRIFVEGGRAVGIQVAQRGKMIAMNAGILGCSLDHAKTYLYPSGGRRSFKRFKVAPRPHGWKFTMALSVHAEAIQQGISKRLVWKEKGAPAIEIEIADFEEYNLGKSENRMLFVRTLMPFSQESLSPAYQKLIAARLFRQLIELMPFLEYHVIRIFPDFREDESFSETSAFRGYQFDKPHLIPDNLRVIEGDGVGFYSGITNLFVANNESYPCWGTYGAVVAAIEALSKYGQLHSNDPRSSVMRGLKNQWQSSTRKEKQGSATHLDLNWADGQI